MKTLIHYRLILLINIKFNALNVTMKDSESFKISQLANTTIGIIVGLARFSGGRFNESLNFSIISKTLKD